MHTGTLKKMALALTFWLALHMSSLKAQFFIGPDSNSSASFGVNTSGLLTDTGTLGTGSLSLSGAGTRMFWYPGKAAFRAGSVDGTQWDDTTANRNVGQYSDAFGFDTIASGYASTAFGSGSTASGYYSVAMGSETIASGDYSTASGGGSSASGAGCVAMGTSCYAIGVGSVAMGSACSAYSPYYGSVAMGYSTSASGLGSVAIGAWSLASGDGSVALGGGQSLGSGSTASGSSTASGDYSSSSGYNTQATSFADFVIGAFNVGLSENNVTAIPSSWNNTPNQADPLFEVGNGTSSDNPSDAFVVYKDGNAAFQGQVTVPQSGDIPMYGE